MRWVYHKILDYYKIRAAAENSQTTGTYILEPSSYCHHGCVNALHTVVSPFDQTYQAYIEAMSSSNKTQKLQILGDGAMT